MSEVHDGKTYRKSFIPLESNPEIFTHLIHKLGVSSQLEFQDVFSIDEPDLLAMLPRPVLALVLIFPSTETYHRQIDEAESKRPEYTSNGGAEGVVWYKQTIYNACGLYAILHAISNDSARTFIGAYTAYCILSPDIDIVMTEPGSCIADFINIGAPLAPEERALILEGSQDLDSAHAYAAKQGDSVVSENPDDEVDHHSICFIKSGKNVLYEMDGENKGPLDRGVDSTEDEDLLNGRVLELVKEYIEREQGDPRFSLMALVRTVPTW